MASLCLGAKQYRFLLTCDSYEYWFICTLKPQFEAGKSVMVQVYFTGLYCLNKTNRIVCLILDFAGVSLYVAFIIFHQFTELKCIYQVYSGHLFS